MPRTSVERAASPNSAYWTPMSQIPAASRGVQNYFSVRSASAFGVNESALRGLLWTAPSERQVQPKDSPVKLSIPTPDGSLETFGVVQYSMMAPELAAQFPSIRTFTGYSLDNPGNFAKFDLTEHGFKAAVRTPEGSYFIDPYYHLSKSVYVSYFKNDGFKNSDSTFKCTTDHSGHVWQAPAGGESTEASTSAHLREYRTAISTTGEYTVFHGGTVASGLSAIVSLVNRMNQVYEIDLAVRMTLVAQQSNVIFTNAATDPFTNPNSVSTTQTQNQNTLDNVSFVGAANYDVGHVVHRGSDNGNAGGIGSVGVNGTKGRGYSSGSNPTTDPWGIDYVAHEFGHQFNGRHTFNNCNGSQGDSSSLAQEPGSGVTIMGYAGICGSTNIASNSDAMFLSLNQEQIISFTQSITPNGGGGVGIITPNGNSIPTVSAGPSYTIPANTPYVLTATASDANGDTLTYSWEQRDGGSVVTLGTDPGFGPIQRPFLPNTNPSRTFPRIQNLVNNTSVTGERLPATNRTLSYAITVRDNRANGGGVNQAYTSVTSVNTGSAFSVTAPNLSGQTYTGGNTFNVTWNVAGTTGSGINTANVAIKLSTDGGFNYPTTLIASTANDGSETITWPNISTTQGRIRVEAVGNIFFDISNFNFQIVPGVSAPGTPALQAGSDTGVSNSDRITKLNNSSAATRLFFDVPSTTSGATVTLLANGVPVGTAVSTGGTTTVQTNGTTTIPDGVINFTATQTISGNTSSPSAAQQVTIDTIAPTVPIRTFGFLTGPQTLSFTFDSDVSATLSLADLLVVRTFNSSPQSVSGFSYGGGNVATFTFSATNLDNGNYTATIDASGVTDIAGNNLNGGGGAGTNAVFNFRYIQGDLNGDGVIDFDDYAIIDGGFLGGLSGYANGDVNRDGVIDFDDYAIIDFNFLNQGTFI
jgi:hypothetical protein